MLKETIAKLEADKRQELMDAFNELRSCVIHLPDNKFIAVHVVPNPKWIVLEQTEYFLYGEL